MGDFTSKYSAHPQQVSPTGRNGERRDLHFAYDFEYILMRSRRREIDTSHGNHTISLHFCQFLRCSGNVNGGMEGKTVRNVRSVNYLC